MAEQQQTQTNRRNKYYIVFLGKLICDVCYNIVLFSNLSAPQEIGPLHGEVAFWSKDSPDQLNTVNLKPANNVIAWKRKDSVMVSNGLLNPINCKNPVGFMRGYEMLDSPGRDIDGSKKDSISAVMTHFWSKLIKNSKGKDISKNNNKDEVLIVLPVSSKYTEEDKKAILEAAKNAKLCDYGHVLLEPVNTSRHGIPDVINQINSWLKRNWLASAVCTKDLIEESCKCGMLDVYQKETCGNDEKIAKQQDVIDSVSDRQHLMDFCTANIKDNQEFETKLKVKIYELQLQNKLENDVVNYVGEIQKQNALISQHKEKLCHGMGKYIAEIQEQKNFAPVVANLLESERNKLEGFATLMNSKFDDQINKYIAKIKPKTAVNQKLDDQEDGYYETLLKTELNSAIDTCFNKTQSYVYGSSLESKLIDQIKQHYEESEKQDTFKLLFTTEGRYKKLLDQYIERAEDSLSSSVKTFIAEEYVSLSIAQIERIVKCYIAFILQPEEELRQQKIEELQKKTLFEEEICEEMITKIHAFLTIELALFFHKLKDLSDDDLIKQVCRYIAEIQNRNAFQMLFEKNIDNQMERILQIDHYTDKQGGIISDEVKKFHITLLKEKLQDRIDEYFKKIQVQHDTVKQLEGDQIAKYIEELQEDDDYETLLKKKLQMMQLKEKLHDQVNKLVREAQEQGNFLALREEKLKVTLLMEEINKKINSYIEETEEQDEIKRLFKEKFSSSLQHHVESCCKGKSSPKRDSYEADIVDIFVGNFPKLADVDAGFKKFISNPSIVPLMQDLLLCQDERRGDSLEHVIPVRFHVRIDFAIKEIHDLKKKNQELIDHEQSFTYDKNTIIESYGIPY
ncbi:hypothetical protein [Parasitella parasitica]|uniref:Uncharacterized protein n=1 Tax=Parasitella parasitica TaxID=35722 RepID=A0A0B7MYF1_9FUNG|nr:hypothetical protein [Parasitella parasitica]